jgi:hypothetical protein
MEEKQVEKKTKGTTWRSIVVVVEEFPYLDRSIETFCSIPMVS